MVKSAHRHTDRCTTFSNAVRSVEQGRIADVAIIKSRNARPLAALGVSRCSTKLESDGFKGPLINARKLCCIDNLSDNRRKDTDDDNEEENHNNAHDARTQLRHYRIN